MLTSNGRLMLSKSPVLICPPAIFILGVQAVVEAVKNLKSGKGSE